MLSRFGLRFRMAASYVAISAAAVLLVEAVVLAYFVPRMKTAGDQVDDAKKQVVLANAQVTLYKTSSIVSDDAVAADGLVAGQGALSDRALLSAVAAHGFGRSGGAPEMAEALADLHGRVVASDAPDVIPVGSALPDGAVSASPRSRSLSGNAAWASSPVKVTTATGDSRVFGVLYLVMSPGGHAQIGPQLTRPGPATRTDAKPTTKPATTDPNGMLLPGLFMLALLIPVGGLFGLLTTRRLIGRIRGLAESTAAVAAGNLRTRLAVSGRDEVGKLEAGFNWMAERLEHAVRAEREAAGAAERGRIARELHDSVSQDLFSVNLLAGGLRRALPPGSELHRQAESMEQTLEKTMREMRAMLLELRPVELEDAGLDAALGRLCAAYEARLGIRITLDVQAAHLDPAVEQAVLRVVQEALGNAARHAEAGAIELRVAEAAGQVLVAISDDGRGFDPARAAERHGMGMAMMRERVSELGGSFEVDSAPAAGTTIQVRIPA